MEMHLWLGFAAASFVLAIVPGPGVASIVGFAMSSGQRVALISVAGMALGNTIAISVSMAGAGAILATSAIAFTVLKWAGALYLIAIGVIAILRSQKTRRAEMSSRPISGRTAFLANVLVGTFHPKTVLFFVAFASQFISVDRPFLPQAAILIATFTAIAAVTDTAYAIGASRAAQAMRNSRLRRWLQRAGGGVLIAAGVATAATRR